MKRLFGGIVDRNNNFEIQFRFEPILYELRIIV